MPGTCRPTLGGPESGRLLPQHAIPEIRKAFWPQLENSTSCAKCRVGCIQTDTWDVPRLGQGYKVLIERKKIAKTKKLLRLNSSKGFVALPEQNIKSSGHAQPTPWATVQRPWVHVPVSAGIDLPAPTYSSLTHTLPVTCECGAYTRPLPPCAPENRGTVSNLSSAPGEGWPHAPQCNVVPCRPCFHMSATSKTTPHVGESRRCGG